MNSVSRLKAKLPTPLTRLAEPSLQLLVELDRRPGYPYLAPLIGGCGRLVTITP